MFEGVCNCGSACLHLYYYLCSVTFISCFSLEASKLTLNEVASQAGIDNLDILDQECSEQVLLSLAKHCMDWKTIGHCLALTSVEIEEIFEAYVIEQKQVGMLRKWKKKFAFKATYRALIEALLSCGKDSDAIAACKAITSSKLHGGSHCPLYVQ